jgi:hypothetical protein
LTPHGDVLWAKLGGGRFDEFANSLSVDAAGCPCIMGHFTSAAAIFGPFQVVNTGGRDIFAAQYDPQGEELWARGAIGNGQDNAWCVRHDSQANVYLAGSYRSSSLTFDDWTLVNTSDDFDLYLVKCDPGGGVIWAMSAEGEDWDDANALAIDADDRLYLAGHYQSDSLRFGTETVYLSSSPSTNIDMYLAKLNADGEPIWVTSSSGGAWIYPEGADAYGASGVAIVGTFNGISGGYPESFGSCSAEPIDSYDIFVVRYDARGDALWSASIGGADMDFGQAVRFDRQMNGYVAGICESDTVMIGEHLLINEHNRKMFIAKAAREAGTAPPDQRSCAPPFQMTCHPNPAGSCTAIWYELPTDKEVTLRVFDATGRLARDLVGRRQPAGGYRIPWDLADREGTPLPSGAYWLTLQSGRRCAIRKIIVAR